MVLEGAAIGGMCWLVVACWRWHQSGDATWGGGAICGIGDGYGGHCRVKGRVPGGGHHGVGEEAGCGSGAGSGEGREGVGGLVAFSMFYPAAGIEDML